MGRHVTDSTQAALSNPSLQVACGGLAYFRAAQRGLRPIPLSPVLHLSPNTPSQKGKKEQLREIFFFFKNQSFVQVVTLHITNHDVMFTVISEHTHQYYTLNWLKRYRQKHLLAKSKVDPFETVIFDEIRLPKWDTLSLRGGSTPPPLSCSARTSAFCSRCV